MVLDIVSPSTSPIQTHVSDRSNSRIEWIEPLVLDNFLLHELGLKKPHWMSHESDSKVRMTNASALVGEIFFRFRTQHMQKQTYAKDNATTVQSARHRQTDSLTQTVAVK